MRQISVPLVLLLVLSLVQSIFAGEITLKNGDRISGKIVDETEDTVVVETAYAGKVTIARTHIIKVVSDAATSTAAKSDVQPTSVTQATAPPPAVPRLQRRSNRLQHIVSGWDGNANIGFSYTSGNANNITMTTGLRAVKASPDGGMTVYFRSLWNSSHRSPATITTQNAFWGGARYDRNLTKKMFGFLSYDFERDKPKRLSFRSVAGGGLGHRTIRNDRTQLEVLAGMAWNRTWQAGGDSDTPEGLVGLNFKQKLNSRMRLQNAFTYFQNVTDRHEYRILFDTSLTTDLTPKIGVYVAVGNRFNNDPLGNAAKNDFLLTTGLKWNFGKKK